MCVVVNVAVQVVPWLVGLRRGARRCETLGIARDSHAVLGRSLCHGSTACAGGPRHDPFSRAFIVRTSTRLSAMVVLAFRATVNRFALSWDRVRDIAEGTLLILPKEPVGPVPISSLSPRVLSYYSSFGGSTPFCVLFGEKNAFAFVGCVAIKSQYCPTAPSNSRGFATLATVFSDRMGAVAAGLFGRC